MTTIEFLSELRPSTKHFQFKNFDLKDLVLVLFRGAQHFKF